MKDFIIKETELAALPTKRRKMAVKLLETACRIMEEGEQSVIRSPREVWELVAADLLSLEQEHFVVLFLNTKNRVIARETIFVGSLNASIVHPREVFRQAMKRSAASIICVHNHPSGDPSPSWEDVEVTRRLIQVGDLVGIEVLDHVVVGKEGFASLKKEGLV